MPFFEAVRLALQVIWNQKMKSAFSVIGVFIGVTFLIAVVTIVEGMNAYMTDTFAGTLLGVNTFSLRYRPNFQVEDTPEEVWRSWRRRLPLHERTVAARRCATLARRMLRKRNSPSWRCGISRASSSATPTCRTPT